MKNIRKYITSILSVIMIFSMTASVNAANEISMSYDFDTTTIDSNWKTDWGSIAIADVDESKVINQSNAWQTVALMFPEAQTSGSIHFSFRYKKKMRNTNSAYMGFYDTRVSEEPAKTVYGSTEERTKVILYTADDSLSLFGDPTNYNNWGNTNQRGSSQYFNKDDWNKVDVIITGIGTDNMVGDTYLNGTCLTTGVTYDYSAAKGIKGLWWCDENAVSYIDDIIVNTYSGEPMIRLSPSDDTFAAENGSVDFTLSEEVTDSTQINSNNVVVTNTNGDRITNFDVANVTNKSFTLTIDGEVPRGLYNVGLTGVTGSSTGITQVESAEIRTEYQYLQVPMSHLNMDFSEYKGGLEVKPGKEFELFQSSNLSEAEAKKGVGDEGQEDIAFMVEDVPVQKNPLVKYGIRSYVYPLDVPIQSNEAVSMSFKVKYSENINWYIKLFDTGTTENSTNRTTDNAVIGFEDGSVVYGNTKSDLQPITDASIANGEWVDVDMEITPQSNASTEIKVTIGTGDAAQTYTLASSRDFYTESVSSIGIAYKATETTNSLLFDDIVISGKANAVYPEVERINVYDYLGDLQSGKMLTSATNKIEVIFNTLVNHESISNGLAINGIYNTNIEPADIAGKTVLNIAIPELLSPSDNTHRNSVSISLSGDIKDATISDLSLLPYSKEYSIAKDAKFEIYDETEVDNGTSEYSFKVVKTNDEAYNMVVVAAAYKVKSIEEKEFKELVGISYIPVEYAADETGIKEFNTSIPLNGCDTVEITRMNMPSMSIYE